MIGEHWKRTGWYFEPGSASEVMTVIARVGTHGSNHRFAWRGLANCNYSLTSSLHRQLVTEGADVTEKLLTEREESILDEARRWGLGVEGGQLVDDLQLLADLQHFGVPTRLIDVTSNPMTALWFATEKVAHTSDSTQSNYSATGLLVALNMPWYNEVETESSPQTVFKTVGRPPATVGELAEGLATKRRAGIELETPFVVSSSMPNPRLRAQEGYFIASSHPENSTPPLVSLNIEVPPGDPEEVRTLLTEDKRRGLPRSLPFVAIFIGSRVKEQLRNYLRMTYSRTAKTLFPDYQGFRDFGKWRSQI
ncbi:FRG domain-containing protein [Nesterenkonia sp. K-15-9-6]|uniref:FRG domain-containing protein n=1 Tax=Nesterenkonia sp. K-15-9-6 TaxID=3093918 RepID=UPI004044D7F6